LLGAEVQKNWFYAKSRDYSSSVEAALDRNNIPVDVYTALIRDVRANLPVLHRMLELRKRILGLESLTYADIYASIVPTVETTYTWEQARPIVIDALSRLGDDYVGTVEQGFDSWFDVYPADGKRGGAYSSGSWYDGHPWILLNYNDSYDSVSTTAHELGHAMHSWLSNHTQPYPTAGYSIMAAEVSSTFNEALLKEKLLAEQSDPKLRMLILGNFLERVRQTVFRQTMFAEFELEIHRRVEEGQALTGEMLSEIYLDLLREYHGHDLGVMEIDELYSVEWAFIPHFYRGFYVYQYATGMVASTALAEKVLAGEPGATERYLAFLAAGGSDYPIALLKKAGVDLTSSEPFETAMEAVTRAMDEIEELLPLVYPTS
jgi:oligoendopeptidase F